MAALADEPQLPISEEAPDPWACELRSAAVVAHARAARLDDVADLADGLVAPLAHLLAHPLRAPLPSFSELSLSGTLLVALASADLARGERLPAVRMIALAERMRFSHNFHPTMSSAGVRAQASAADAGAYEQARADYAGLGPDELRRAGLDLLAQRRGSRL